MYQFCEKKWLSDRSIADSLIVYGVTVK